MGRSFCLINNAPKWDAAIQPFVEIKWGSYLHWNYPVQEGVHSSLQKFLAILRRSAPER